MFAHLVTMRYLIIEPKLRRDGGTRWRSWSREFELRFFSYTCLVLLLTIAVATVFFFLLLLCWCRCLDEPYLQEVNRRNYGVGATNSCDNYIPTAERARLSNLVRHELRATQAPILARGSIS